MRSCEDTEWNKNSASLCLCVRKKAKNQATSKNNCIFFEFAIIFCTFAPTNQRRASLCEQHALFIFLIKQLWTTITRQALICVGREATFPNRLILIPYYILVTAANLRIS